MHVIIEIAISMVGLYIIFSIANSALVEGYAQLINKRGNHLKQSLDNFFQDPNNAEINLAKDLYDHKLIPIRQGQGLPDKRKKKPRPNCRAKLKKRFNLFLIKPPMGMV